MNGQLPPSSSVHFFSPLAHRPATILPTRVLPVNVTFLTSGCTHMASLSDGVLAKPVVSTLNTPGAKPAWLARCASVRHVSGVSGDGLTTMVQPAASAAPALRRIMAMGKFHGTSATATPMGCLMTKVRRLGADGVYTEPWMRSASPANHHVKPVE